MPKLSNYSNDAMKANKFIILVFGVTVLTACNKYKNVTNIQLSGYVYIHDTLNSSVPIPMSKEPVFIGNGTDTVSYILQSMTDTAGYYSVAYFGQQQGVVYTRFSKGNTEFIGKNTLKGTTNRYFQANLQVYPVYINGLAIIMTDPHGGPVSNYPIRLYTNLSAAMTDSTQFAYVNTKTGTNGRYTQYNVNAATYYITGIDSISGKKPVYLDSIRVKGKGLFFKTIQLKQ